MWVLVLVPLIQKPVVNASSQTHKGNEKSMITVANVKKKLYNSLKGN